MSRPLHMALGVATLAIFAGGCASVTGGGRTGLANRWRTIASSGGSRVSADSGPPGGSVAAELGDPEVERRGTDGRISGRVLDDQGRAVAGAEVRLADGGARAGRDIRTRTDDAGGFTLSGLRAGARYTVIAQADDDRALLIGRASADAPSGNVRIRLHEEGSEVAEAEEESPPRHVSRASNRNPVEETLDGGDVESSPPTGRRVNDDDLPPAQEAESIDTPQAGRRPDSPKNAWRRGTADPEVAAAKASELNRPGMSDHKPEEPAKPAPAEDDGPNPLPPAKERTEDKPEPTPTVTPAPTTSSPPPSAAPASTQAPALDPPPSEVPAPLETAPAPAPEAPGAPVESAAIPAESAPRRRATWADVASQQANEPPASGSVLPRSTRRFPTTEAETPAAKTADGRGRFGFLGLNRAKKKEQSADPSTGLAVAPASCNYDPKMQRIVDFQLPDLQGNPVHLRDIDADFVLLDFWGTWCGPCRESIPHLMELQSRYGAKTLQVVGIATEHEATPAERAKKVESVATAMGVNYPLLLSEADGQPCPLQESLHVQAYPTMILVDRTGRILWRGTGAEGITLSRLDRVIAARADTAVLRR